jgi:glycosyltransferase involved in cell wall biosynthesis
MNDSTTRRAAEGQGPAAARDVPGARPLVVYLSASGMLGGAERVLLDMVQAIGEQADPPRQLVIVAAGGPLVESLREAGVETEVMPWPAAVARLGDYDARGIAGLARLAIRAVVAFPRALFYVKRLRDLLRQRQPAIVHTNGFKMHVLGAIARPASSRLVWHLHDFTSPRPVMGRALRRFARRCDAAIANSRAVADDAAPILGARVPTIAVLNAVDLDRFRPDGPRDDVDARAGVEPAAADTVRVGIVATLARWKGHDVFLRALARLPRTLPVRGYVVSGALYQTDGSQWSLDELRTLAQELGLGDRVAFTGFVPDAASVMRALDIVVHASTRPEPFGLVIAEAMATGRAVILSAAGGAVELARDGVSARFVTPGDDAALAARIEELVRDGAARRRLGDAAAAEARSRFGRARFGSEVRAVHEAVLASRVSPHAHLSSGA